MIFAILSLYKWKKKAPGLVKSPSLKCDPDKFLFEVASFYT